MGPLRPDDYESTVCRTGNLIGVAVAAASNASARSLMTSGFNTVERPPAYCGNCCGKGFALDQGKNRHSRKCPRCRGKGAVSVGSTKR